MNELTLDFLISLDVFSAEEWIHDLTKKIIELYDLVNFWIIQKEIWIVFKTS